MPEVKLDEIKRPKAYIRKRISKGYVAELVEIAKESKEWPFPPVTLTRTARATKQTKKGGKPLRETTIIEVIDGNHRIETARELKYKTIPAEFKEFKTPADAYLYQYKSNVSHGLKLNKDLRDEAIRVLHFEHKVNQADLVKATGLTQASVSRILSKKQRTGAPRKKSKGGKETKKARVTTTDEAFSPKAFLERIGYLVEEFEEHNEALAQWMAVSRQLNKEKAMELAQGLMALASNFDDMTKKIGSQADSQ